MQLRLNRFLAEAGLGSRRGVEELIRAGKVRVDGVVVTELGTKVDPEAQRVSVSGKPVRAAVAQRLIVYHKPLGVICSFRRQGPSPCLADVLPGEWRGGRLFHIGRLDRDSTGLLLLGSDGELAQRLLHPRRPVYKRYRVRIDLELAAQDLRAIRQGEIELDGASCAPARIRRSGGAAGRCEYEIELREGRNRQIRRMLELFGAHVLSLHRLAFGPIELRGLQVGGWREATARELAALREAAGLVDAASDSD